MSSLQVHGAGDTLQTLSHVKAILKALNENFHVTYFFLLLQREVDLFKRRIFIRIACILELRFSIDGFLHEWLYDENGYLLHGSQKFQNFSLYSNNLNDSD